MDNKMVEVAKLLGVEVGEVFQVDGDPSLKDCVFRFSDNDLQVSAPIGDKDTWIVANDNRLLGLLYGNLSIRKLPWKPAIGDRYCYSDPSSPIMWGRCSWTGYGVDIYRFNHGLVFRTKEEAIALTKKLLAVAQEANDE
jgi:hypothetical protein